MHESDIRHSSYELAYHGLCNLNDNLPAPAIYEQALDRHECSLSRTLRAGHISAIPNAMLDGIGDHPEKIIVPTDDARAARLAAMFRETFADHTGEVSGNINAAGPA